MHGYAQETDTTLVKVRTFHAADFFRSKNQHPSASLDDIQKYSIQPSLGNIGLPLQRLLIDFDHGSLGFRYWDDHMHAYRVTQRNIHYYDTQTPYTSLNFLLGVQRETKVGFVHSQNVTPRLNFTLRFDRIRSEGFYNRQNTNNNTLSLSSNFRSKKNRYYLLSNLIYNGFNYADNGGISSDSIFQNDGLINRKLMEVNLSSAQKQIREKEFFIQQFLNFGSKKTKQLNDSVTQTYIVPSHHFSHAFHIKDYSFEYEDIGLNPYYNAIYYDSLSTHDSLYYYQIENNIYWTLLKNKNNGGARKVGLTIGLGHQINVLKQFEIDSLSENIFINAKLFDWVDEKTKIHFKLEGQYIMAGRNEGDYLANAFISYHLDSLNYFKIVANTNKRTADFVFNRYAANYFFWENNFNKTAMQHARLQFTSEKAKMELGLNVFSVENHLYFDSLALPAQYNGKLNILSADIASKLSWKGLHFNNKITYQIIPASSVIRLPELVTKHSLYYERGLFKKVMYTQIGLDVNYNSAYLANAYNPANAQFYLQDKTLIGNYAYADIFLNIKVKTVRAFIKYAHINSGLNGFNYFYTPGYPSPDRALKFGIIWDFFN